jgi:Endonuclease/Exonuclease/phosphatase family
MSDSMPSAVRRPAATILALLLLLGAVLVAAPPTAARDRDRDDEVRFATFNASLNRNAAGQALIDLSTPGNAQANAVAEIIQRVRPEVVLINEFDYIDGPVTGNALTTAFQDNYLSIGLNGAKPIDYPYVYVAPSNTGISSGFDLNNNGVTDITPGDIAYGDDSLGFGEFPGKFGMAVFSQHPIDYDEVRTFQHFKWKDMPGALLPDIASTPAPNDFYSAEELAIFPLSSKSHWDIPIKIGRETVHFLASHPTPPVFDGPEDRNGRRNFDEIRLWADYITGGKKASYIYDDAGEFGGLRTGASFVIAGDQNSDPRDGDSVPGAIQQLLDNRRVNDDDTPSSKGAREASQLQGGANATHRSNPKFDTADFADGAPGNLRADYVLPSKDLRIRDSAVFWPVQADPLFRLTGVFPFPSSDHRLVWVDVRVSGGDDDDDDDDDD